MNAEYKKAIAETENCTIIDFIEVCDKLQLPVFEVETIINPFAEPHEKTKTNMFNSMTEYRKQMPYWSAMAYDYELDCTTYYLDYPEMQNGAFEIRSSNSSSIYVWNFQVLENAIHIHSKITYTD